MLLPFVRSSRLPEAWIGASWLLLREEWGVHPRCFAASEPPRSAIGDRTRPNAGAGNDQFMITAPGFRARGRWFAVHGGRLV